MVSESWEFTLHSSTATQLIGRCGAGWALGYYLGGSVDACRIAGCPLASGVAEGTTGTIHCSPMFSVLPCTRRTRIFKIIRTLHRPSLVAWVSTLCLLDLTLESSCLTRTPGNPKKEQDVAPLVVRTLYTLKPRVCLA